MARLTLIGVLWITLHGKPVAHALKHLHVVPLLLSLEDIESILPRLRAERMVVFRTGQQ